LIPGLQLLLCQCLPNRALPRGAIITVSIGILVFSGPASRPTTVM
jgi:hypothetical protein